MGRTRTRFFVILIASTLGAVAAAEDQAAVIAAGSAVGLEYTMSRAASGELLQSNVNGEAFQYVQGEGRLLPRLEEALRGRKVHDEFDLTVAAEDAYGAVNPDAVQDVSLEQIPEDARVVGALLNTPSHPTPIRVVKLQEDVASLDFNHPLAGEDLHFKLRVLSVLPPTATGVESPETTVEQE